MSRLKLAKWFVGLSTVVLIASACQQEEAPGPQEPAEDALGTVEIAPGQPLSIGSIQVISGDSASLGEDQVRAIELAIDDRGGEILGHPVELQSEDGECLAEGGQAAAQKLVADPQLVAVVGTSCSGEAVPAAQIFQEQGIVMISGSNTTPFLTSLAGEEGTDHQDIYFRTAHNDEIQGAAAAQFAFEELGVTQAASIHDGDPYTEGLAGTFNTSFEELGGEIVLATAISKGDTDLRPVLTEVAAAGAELIFFPIFEPEGPFVVEQASEVDGLQDTALMGADGLLTDTFLETEEATEAPPGPNGESPGMYFSGPSVPESPEYEEFVGRYEEAYGEAPIGSFHAQAYDASNMLFDAIEQVAEEQPDGSVSIGRQALLDAVAATSDFQGLSGTLTCDEFGDCADPNIKVFQYSADVGSLDALKRNVLFSYEEA
jgi:branched-chain amino acid transport system substrate-binding protein